MLSRMLRMYDAHVYSMPAPGSWTLAARLGPHGGAEACRRARRRRGQTRRCTDIGRQSPVRATGAMSLYRRGLGATGRCWIARGGGLAGAG